MALPGDFVDPDCPLDWSHPLSVGLVADWTIVPNSGWRGGLTLRDLVRGGRKPNDGTLTNGPTWAGSKGRPGGFGAISYDGSNDKTVLASTVTLADFSAFVWAKCSGDCAIFGLNGASQPQLRIGQGGANKLSTFDDINNPQSSTLPVSQTSWSHVGFTRVGSTVTFWQNGVSYGTGTMDPSRPSNHGKDFNQIGAFLTASNVFNGQMDGFTLHSRALSAAQVRALYAETKLGNPEWFRWVSTRAWSIPAVATGNRRRRVICGRAG